MSLIKVVSLFCCLFSLLFFIHLKINQHERQKAYKDGYNDGMASISPDYCLKEFAQHNTVRLRRVQRNYCKGITK